MTNSLRCGRLTEHPPHTWRGAWHGGWPFDRRDYHCAGHVLTEMERTRFDAEDDTAEERANTERRGT